MVTISIDDKLAQELAAIAKDLGKSVEQLAAESLRGTIERARYLAAIDRGREDVKAGRIVDGDKVDAWLESWGTDHELDPP